MVIMSSNLFVPTAYLRRSMAYRFLKLYKEAKNDLQKLLSLDPNNKRAKVSILIL